MSQFVFVEGHPIS